MPTPAEIQRAVSSLSGNPEELSGYMKRLSSADYSAWATSAERQGNIGAKGVSAILPMVAGLGAGAVGGLGSAVSSLPWYAKLGGLAAAGAGIKSAVSGRSDGGGGGSGSNLAGYADIAGGSLPGLPATAPGAQGAASSSSLADIIAALGGTGGGGGTDHYGTMSAADQFSLESRGLDINQFSAETQRAMSEAQIADLMYQRTVDEANLALKRGDLQLAREKFEDSKIWASRAADANDEANRLTGIGRQVDAYGTMGNLQLGALDTQTKAYGQAGGLTNEATGLQLRGLGDAGQLELAGYGTQGDILGKAGGLGISNFSAIEDAILGRGNLGARGAENYSNLTSILGNLGIAQQQLGLQIATTPRNAIAAFLMGAGQSGQGAQMFNPQNILGINPAQIQGVIQSALNSAAQVGNLPAMEKFDVNGIISGMTGAANNAATTGAANAAGIRGVANQAPGRVSGDVNALRQVGASAPGVIQSAVSGLSNAAASVANKAPATVPGAATSANPYATMIQQLVAGGAPQIAIDQLKNTATAAGYGV